MKKVTHTLMCLLHYSSLSVLNCSREGSHGVRTGQESTCAPSVNLVAGMLGTFSDRDTGKALVHIRGLGLNVGSDTARCC